MKLFALQEMASPKSPFHQRRSRVLFRPLKEDKACP